MEEDPKQNSTYKWRRENPEKYREIVRRGVKRHYYNNIEKISLKKKEYYLAKKDKLLKIDEEEPPTI